MKEKHQVCVKGNCRLHSKGVSRRMAKSSNGKHVQPAIPKFDGHCEHWAKLMVNFLRSKEYWSLVENGISTVVDGVVPTEAQLKVIEEQKSKDSKIKNLSLSSY